MGGKKIGRRERVCMGEEKNFGGDGTEQGGAEGLHVFRGGFGGER